MSGLNKPDPGSDYMRDLDSAKAFILEQDNFLVVSHVNPDGDAIGSTLAVGEMLRLLGKSYLMVNEGSPPGRLHMLTGLKDILNFGEWVAAGKKPSFGCVIAVDCADYKRLGRVSEWLAGKLPLLNIDHHPTNDSFGSVNVIRPDAAATAEILYDLVEHMGVEWTRAMADCVYTGLLTDTGGFRYSNTSPKVLNIASEMLHYGVEGNELADELLEKMTYSHVMLLQKALAKLAFTEDRRIAWTDVTLAEISESGAVDADLEGLVNYPRNIEGVEVGMLFKEIQPGKWKVSFRSAGLVDVAAVAQKFGGGGHVRAAGCSVSGTAGQAVEQIIQEVRRALP